MFLLLKSKASLEFFTKINILTIFIKTYFPRFSTKIFTQIYIFRFLTKIQNYRILNGIDILGFWTKNYISIESERFLCTKLKLINF